MYRTERTTCRLELDLGPSFPFYTALGIMLGNTDKIVRHMRARWMSIWLGGRPNGKISEALTLYHSKGAMHSFFRKSISSRQEDLRPLKRAFVVGAMQMDRVDQSPFYRGKTNSMELTFKKLKTFTDRNRLDPSRSAVTDPIVSCFLYRDRTICSRLSLIAGIFRNVARFQFSQRFPDEIASA